MLLFLGFILYIVFLAISAVVCIPMLLIKSKKVLATKMLITAAISFPCLIVVALTLTVIILLPALLFFWMVNNNYIPKTAGVIFSIGGLLIYIAVIAICSLYLWYITSNVIYKRLDNMPISEFLDRDKIYNYLKPFLTKFLGL